MGEQFEESTLARAFVVGVTIWSEHFLGGEHLRESTILSGDQFGVSTFFRVNDLLQGVGTRRPCSLGLH